MKKSFFGFSAKVAMAVLAVCSFVLTSCYEKSPIAKTATSYRVVGTVYAVNLETGVQEVLSGAQITVDGKSATSNPFTIELSQYVPSVTVVASAPGYLKGEKTVKIEKIGDNNRVSITNVDLVLVPEDYKPGEEETPELEISAEVTNASMTASEVTSLFSIENGEVSVGDYVQVHTHYCLDSDLHANVHMNFHANHANGVTSEPYLVKDVHYVGFIADMSNVSEEYAQEAIDAAVIQLNTQYNGSAYADFAAKAVPFTYMLNENGEISLAGYCVCRSFNLWTVSYTVDGTEMTAYALEAVNTTAQAIAGADSHDNHDNGHDNGGDHNNAHHSGATAWGGGSSVEGE